MLNVLIYALTHKKRERILRFCIIYKVLNIAVKSNFFYFLYVKIFIDKAQIINYDNRTRLQALVLTEIDIITKIVTIIIEISRFIINRL